MADGAYRDDRYMLRAKIEELQAEIAALKAEMLTKVSTLPPGPAKKCKGCGADFIIYYYSDGRVEKSRERALAEPKACTPDARVSMGWFRSCNKSGEHLHEKCKACGLKWLTAFAAK